MSGIAKLPFRKASDPKALLFNVAEEDGDRIEKVLIVGIGKDGERILASSHFDESFMLLCHALVEHAAFSSVFAPKDDE
jgi:hypothetical protein